MKRIIPGLLIMASVFGNSQLPAQQQAQNPVIFADVPDMSISGKPGLAAVAIRPRNKPFVDCTMVSTVDRRRSADPTGASGRGSRTKGLPSCRRPSRGRRHAIVTCGCPSTGFARQGVEGLGRGSSTLLANSSACPVGSRSFIRWYRSIPRCHRHGRSRDV